MDGIREESLVDGVRYVLPPRDGGGLLKLVRAEVVVTDRELTAVERIGPLRFRNRRTASQVQRLRVGPALVHSQAGERGQVFHAIHAEGDGMDPLKLAPGYRREMLDDLAQQLAERIGVPMGGSFDEDDAAMHRFEPPSEPLFEQPADSNAALQRRGDEVTITLPAAGLWRGSKGLFFFAIVWNGFMAVFTTAIALGGDWQHWVPLLVACLFWLVGVWMLLTAINMGRRRAIIDVVGDVLLSSGLIAYMGASTARSSMRCGRARLRRSAWAPAARPSTGGRSTNCRFIVRPAASWGCCLSGRMGNWHGSHRCCKRP